MTKFDDVEAIAEGNKGFVPGSQEGTFLKEVKFPRILDRMTRPRNDLTEYFKHTRTNWGGFLAMVLVE